MYNRHWGHDHRRYQRLNLNLVVWYKVVTPDELRQKFGDKEREVVTIDVSPLGMAFTCIYQIPVYSGLALKFIVFSANYGSRGHLAIPLEITGEVRSCIPHENNEYRVGVYFKQIESNKQVELMRLMRDSLRPCI
ncbi:MAG: PilZ domain-containing protein [Candidatus Pacebacteria bacterium]|nr:PilZ domain-containing protein [Candidatus Paceibacterota bacterium]